MKTRSLYTATKAYHEGWTKIVLPSLLAITAATANIAYAQTCNPHLYGAAYSGPDDLATLYSINPVTGRDQKIGATGTIGFERVSGMDVDPDTGIIYAVGELPGATEEEPDTPGADYD